MHALGIAASGMQAQQLNVDVISHNIANMNTTAYKRQRAEFRGHALSKHRAPRLDLLGLGRDHAARHPDRRRRQGAGGGAHHRTRRHQRKPAIPTISPSTGAAIFKSRCPRARSPTRARAISRSTPMARSSPRTAIRSSPRSRCRPKRPRSRFQPRRHRRSDARRANRAATARPARTRHFHQSGGPRSASATTSSWKRLLPASPTRQRLVRPALAR